VRPADAEAEAYLKSSALRLARLCRKHFGITGTPDKLRVERTVRKDDVVAFLREYGATIRPQGLSATKVLPTANEAVLRTFLWTNPIADAVLNDVVRLSLYSDQIVITDPFSKFFSNRPFRPGPAGPQAEPEKWIEQFVNWGLLICALESWFEHDLALLIVDPEGFVPDLPPFEATAFAAMQGGLLPKPTLEEASQETLEWLALSTQTNEEIDSILGLTLDTMPELSLERRALIREAMIAYRAANPTRYVHRVPGSGSILSTGSGHNLFKAAWLADHVGGFLVPRGVMHRRLFRGATRGDQTKDSEDALASAFVGADLPMLNNVSLATALDLRRSGRLAGFRSFLHEVWSATSDPGEQIKSGERERRLADHLRAAHAQAKDEWHEIYKDLGVKGATALFGGVNVAQVIHAGLIPASGAVLVWLYNNWSGKARAFRRKPEALLIQLEQQSSPNPLRRALSATERRI
jgi:hypothetical protein